MSDSESLHGAASGLRAQTHRLHPDATEPGGLAAERLAEVDEACDAATPFCYGGSCVACVDTDDGDASCAGLDAATPVCEQGSATCVECTPDAAELCTGGTPICDELTFTCDKCTEHYQCGSTACNRSRKLPRPPPASAGSLTLLFCPAFPRLVTMR